MIIELNDQKSDNPFQNIAPPAQEHSSPDARQVVYAPQSPNQTYAISSGSSFQNIAPPAQDHSSADTRQAVYAPQSPNQAYAISSGSSSSSAGGLQPPPYASEYARSRASIGRGYDPNNLSPTVHGTAFDDSSRLSHSSSFTSPPSTPAFPPALPPSFSRSPPVHAAFSTFQPMFLVAQGKYLNKGFLAAPPPSNSQPHPFATHDVHQRDWLDFLDQVKEAGTLTKKQIAMSHVPIISMVPIVNIIVAHGIRAYLKTTKATDVVEVVDRWNHHFFQPRRMQVMLMRGHAKLSGQKDRPIPNLYTPETVDASNMPVNFSFTPDGRDPACEPVKRKDKEAREEDKDQTYRLFIVPL